MQLRIAASTTGRPDCPGCQVGTAAADGFSKIDLDQSVLLAHGRRQQALRTGHAASSRGTPSRLPASLGRRRARQPSGRRRQPVPCTRRPGDCTDARLRTAASTTGRPDGPGCQIRQNWSRPIRARACSVLARMFRYRAARPGTGRHQAARPAPRPARKRGVQRRVKTRAFPAEVTVNRTGHRPCVHGVSAGSAPGAFSSGPGRVSDSRQPPIPANICVLPLSAASSIGRAADS